MILVTTGTHEQQFNRLIGAVDELSRDIAEDFYAQYGYETRPPIHIKGERIIDNAHLNARMKEARIIITHGGPGSIWGAFELNKIPVVVPRQKQFGEHVDDHQLVFATKLAENKRVVLVKNISELRNAILAYEHLAADCRVPSEAVSKNKADFCSLLRSLT